MSVLIELNVSSDFSTLHHYHYQDHTVHISSKKMKPTLAFTSDTRQVKKTTYLKNGVFLVYAPKKINIFPTQFERNDTEIPVTLPEHYHGYLLQNSDQTRSKQLLAINNEFG